MTKEVMEKKQAELEMEKLFLALSDRTRLRLLNLMGEDEVCVCFFVEILGESQPKISRHLAYLRRAGVVAARREGKWIHYRVVDPPNSRAVRIFREILGWLREEPEMQNDRARLVKVCCAPKLPSALRSAPLPASVAK